MYACSYISRADLYDNIEFLNRAKTKARIPSLANPDSSYHTDINDMSCTCGQPQVSGLPDVHLVAHANAAGYDLGDYIDHRYTMEGYKVCVSLLCYYKGMNTSIKRLPGYSGLTDSVSFISSNRLVYTVHVCILYPLGNLGDTVRILVNLNL